MTIPGAPIEIYEVTSGKYHIHTIQGHEEFRFSITKVQHEIVSIFRSEKLKKIAVARNIDKGKLIELIEEFNPENEVEDSLINVKLIGGDNTPQALNHYESLIKWFIAVDDNRDIINITGSDTCAKPHPESFEVNCNGEYLVLGSDN